MTNLEYTGLKGLVSDFAVERRLDGISHYVVAVHPSNHGDTHDSWEINFKSDRIAEQVMEWMENQEDKYLREICDTFYNYAEGSTLAGWVFEAIVHRVFFKG